MRRLPGFTASFAVSNFDVVLSWPDPPRPGGEGKFCLVGSGLDACGLGTFCTPLVGSTSAVGNCCFRGRINCRGTCRNPCLPGTTLDPQTCLCVTVCQPCPAYGMVQDPDTCVCQCAESGQIPCNGICIDPKTDQTFCGGCPGDTCNPYDEACCKGVCTELNSKQHCRGCDDQVPVGWDCCDWTPTELGTKNNCRSCDEHCLGGRECTATGCRCPAGRTACGVCCPPTHKGCCNLTCTNLDTNTSHCGYCDHKCPAGASCQNGQCVCPPTTRDCGGVCWPNTQLCCQNSRCPANATDCCPDCRDYRSSQGQPWMTAWLTAHPNTPWATCVDGNFECHPSLSKSVVPIPEGGFQYVCCPLGTAPNSQGFCQ